MQTTEPREDSPWPDQAIVSLAAKVLELQREVKR